MARKVSLQEVADEYGLCTRTIRNYIAQGLLTAYRVGPRVIRLDPDEVHAQLGEPISGDFA